jgi:ribulose 1,5-bisphosphate synthetase/thiazole synthase
LLQIPVLAHAEEACVSNDPFHLNGTVVDVIVVGAGHSGLVVAKRLVEYGLSVRVWATVFLSASMAALSET